MTTAAWENSERAPRRVRKSPSSCMSTVEHRRAKAMPHVVVIADDCMCRGDLVWTRKPAHATEAKEAICNRKLRPCLDGLCAVFLRRSGSRSDGRIGKKPPVCAPSVAVGSYYGFMNAREDRAVPVILLQYPCCSGSLVRRESGSLVQRRMGFRRPS